MRFTVLWAKTIKRKISKSTFTFVSSKNLISGMLLFWLQREKRKGPSKTWDNQTMEDHRKRKKNPLSRANSSLALNLSQIQKLEASTKMIWNQRKIFITAQAQVRTSLGKTRSGCCGQQKERSRSQRGSRSGKIFKGFLTRIQRTTSSTAIGTICWVCQMSLCMRWIKGRSFPAAKEYWLKKESEMRSDDCLIKISK